MKKSNYFLAVLAVLFSFTACNNIPEPPIPSPEDQPTLIFLEEFGSPVQSGTPLQWPTLAQFTELDGFETTGYGAGYVSFVSAETGGRVDVRYNSHSNYLGASGGGNVMFSAANGGTFFVYDIAVLGAQNLVLSFGTNQTDEIITAAYLIHADGQDWNELSFVKPMATWGLVSDLNIELPKGTNTISLRFTGFSTTHGARIDDIRLTTTDCIINPETEEVNEPIIDSRDGLGATTLEVSPASIEFSEGGGSLPIVVTSNIAWTATSSNPNFAIETTRNSVVVTATPNTGARRTATITLETVDRAETKTVNITQEGDVTIPVATLIFNETFGNPTANTDVNIFTGWVTTGIGAENVTFSRTGGMVDVRTTAPSTGYPGASGGGNAMFNLANGGTFFVNNIAVCGAQSLIFSFGTNETSEVISVYYSIDGDENWQVIPFTKTTANTWDLVDNLPINLPAGTNTISLRFIAAPRASGPGIFNARIDDITIVTYDTTSGC